MHTGVAHGRRRHAHLDQLRGNLPVEVDERGSGLIGHLECHTVEYLLCWAASDCGVYHHIAQSAHCGLYDGGIDAKLLARLAEHASVLWLTEQLTRRPTEGADLVG